MTIRKFIKMTPVKNVDKNKQSYKSRVKHRLYQYKRKTIKKGLWLTNKQKESCEITKN